MGYLGKFIRATVSDWPGRMTGPPSLPLAILALFVQPPIFKICFAVLGVTCFVFAAYRVWKREYEVCLRLQSELAQTRTRALSGQPDVRLNVHTKMGYQQVGLTVQNCSDIQAVCVSLSSLVIPIGAAFRDAEHGQNNKRLSVREVPSLVRSDGEVLLHYEVDTLDGDARRRALVLALITTINIHALEEVIKIPCQLEFSNLHGYRWVMDYELQYRILPEESLTANYKALRLLVDPGDPREFSNEAHLENATRLIE